MIRTGTGVIIKNDGGGTIKCAGYTDAEHAAYFSMCERTALMKGLSWPDDKKSDLIKMQRMELKSHESLPEWVFRFIEIGCVFLP